MKIKLPNLARMFRYREFNIAFSLLVALMGWTIVATMIEPDYTGTVARVPVNFAYNNSVYKGQGLDIVGIQEVTVDIRINGNRSFVGTLTAEDFLVSVRYESVELPGNYELPIIVAKANSFDAFSIVSASISTINLTFDRVASKKLTIEPDVSNIEIADGYVLGIPVCTPTEVNIQGPEAEITRVFRAVTSVVPVSSEPLSARATIVCKLVLLDSAGDPIVSEHILTDTTEPEVTIPILKTGELTPKISFINTPPEFSEDILKYSFSQTNISVAGPEQSIDSSNELMLGYIDLSTFELDAEYDFDVVLPSSYINLSGISSITVEFDTSNLSKRVVTVETINIINTPSGKTVNLQSVDVKNVVLIGLTERLTSLVQDAIVAEVDASAITVLSGKQNVPVRIFVPASNKIFAVGEYSVVVEAV